MGLGVGEEDRNDSEVLGQAGDACPVFLFSPETDE